MACALPDIRAIRKPRVFMPRSTSHASNGPGTPPPAVRQSRTLASSAASRDTTAPPSTSEWPEIALVSEYTDATAPRSSGRCSSPVATELSTTNGAPAAAAIAPSAARSATRNSGLVGVSAHSTDGRAPTARCTAARSSWSTGTAVAPCGRSFPASARTL
jgi:hypothetical protein